MSLTKRHDMDLAARVVPNRSVQRNRANLLLSVCAYRNHRPCSKDRARGNDHEYDCAFQSMVGIEVMESTCEANDTKGPSGKETFPEARLRAASGGLQGGHHRA